MRNVKLHLIRHGLTQSNLDGVYAGGRMDIPLSGEGRSALEQMANKYRYPQVDTLFCSPMRRALESAAILFPLAANRLVLEELREISFGIYEGRSMAELAKDPQFAQWLDPQSAFTPEGGESGGAFAARAAKALGNMLLYMMKNQIFEAACVTHGGVIMSMLAQKALPRRPATQWMADCGAGYTVQASAAQLMRDDLVEATAVVPLGYLG